MEKSTSSQELKRNIVGESFVSFKEGVHFFVVSIPEITLAHQVHNRKMTIGKSQQLVTEKYGVLVTVHVQVINCQVIEPLQAFIGQQHIGKSFKLWEFMIGMGAKVRAEDLCHEVSFLGFGWSKNRWLLSQGHFKFQIYFFRSLNLILILFSSRQIQLMSVSSTLDKIIKPEYRSRFKDWEQYASKEDILGLDCISEIYASKGNRTIRISLPIEKQMYDTQDSLMKRKHKNSLDEAEENFRRKQLTTTYQYFHGSFSAPKKPKNNVFQFKTLANLKLSKPLTQMACTFIDNWLSLKVNNKKYEEAVLQCLRSLNSKIHVSDPHSTEMRTCYDWKNDWSLTKPVRIDKAGEDLFAFKPNYEAIRKQEQKKIKHREKIKELEQSDFAKQLEIFKDFKIN